MARAMVDKRSARGSCSLASRCLALSRLFLASTRCEARGHATDESPRRGVSELGRYRSTKARARARRPLAQG